MKNANKKGYMKRARKRDANEPEIIAILEYVRAKVYPTDKPLDLIVGYQMITRLMEVKNPNGKNRMEQDQIDFFDEWTGGPASVVRTQLDALMSLGFSLRKASDTVRRFKKGKKYI